jgi:DNA-binding NtrC family response regulator
LRSRPRTANSSPQKEFRVAESRLDLAATRLGVRSLAGPQPVHDRSSDTSDPFIGSSPEIRSLERQAHLAAATGHHVLILGEPGAGKRSLARWLHAHGPRRDHPLAEIPCRHLSEEQLDATLFGRADGALGRGRGRRGIAELAEGGSLLLVGVDALTLALQAKLLGVLEAGRFRRTGELQSRRIDVQFLATAGPDLPRLAEEGRFRRALYFCLAALTLEMPPPGGRGEDAETAGKRTSR